MDKFSILIRKIDTEKIKERISEFRIEKGYDPYIICSKITFVDLTSPSLGSDFREYIKSHKVFMNDDIDYGDIELR